MRALLRPRRSVIACCLIALAAAGAGAYLFRPAPPAPLADAGPDDPEGLRERNRLAEDARRLELAGRLDEAAARLEQRLAVERERLGPDHSEQAATLLELGRLRADAGDVPAARDALERAKSLAPANAWPARDAHAGLAALDAPHPAERAVRAALREARSAADAGAFRDAVTAAERALAAGPVGRARSEALFALGSLAREHGDTYPRAREHLAKALTELEQTHGPDHPLRAACLCAAASLEEDRGEFGPAERHLKDALEVFKAARGERSPEYAAALRQLGRMYAAWHIRDATDVCLRALQIREQILGPEHRDCAESTIDLGILAANQLDYARAVRLLKSAVEGLERAYGPDHPRAAEALSWLGVAHTGRCEFTQARVCHRRAMKITERTRGTGHLLYARYTIAFADLCGESERDYLRPRLLLEQAIATRDALGCGEHPEQGFALALLATQYQATCQPPAVRDPVRAAAATTRALELYERIPAGTLSPIYVRVLATSAELGFWANDPNPAFADCDARLAKAVASVKAQQAGRDETLHSYYRYILRSRSRIAVMRGDADAAVRHAAEYVDSVRKAYGADHAEHVADSLSVLFTCLMRYGRFGEAPAHIREALEMVARQSATLEGQAERSRLAFVVPYYLTLSCALSVATELSGNLSAADAEDLYGRTLRYRGLVGARQAEDRLAFDHPELQPKLADVRSARAGLVTHLLDDPKDAAARGPWLDELVRRTDDKEDLEAELAEACRPFATGRDLLAVGTADVKVALPPDAVLIDFVHYVHFRAPPPGRHVMVREPRMGAFVVSRDRGPVYVPLGLVAPVREAVDHWRQCVADIQGGKPADIAAAAKRVAKLVWQPVAAHVGGAKTVLVSPEGPLCFLPFAALPGRNPGEYLIHDHTIGYLPSGRWLVDHARRSAARSGSGLLSVGGIRYGGRPGSAVASRGRLLGAGEWDDLPGSEPESGRARELFARHHPAEPAELLSGEVHKEKLLAGLARRPRVFHFAGHGYFAGDAAARALLDTPDVGSDDASALSPLELQTFSRNQQLLSGLVLSGANATAAASERGRSVLTAEEVGSLDLRGTELVVLSACETGLGNVAGNEGPLGLQRAFLNAGAASVATSLWKVDDAATSLLMQEFYRNLWERKLPRLEAMRQAQLAVMKKPAEFVTGRGPRLVPVGIEPPTPALGGECGPALWAAFVLSGTDK